MTKKRGKGPSKTLMHTAEQWREKAHNRMWENGFWVGFSMGALSEEEKMAFVEMIGILDRRMIKTFGDIL